MPTIINPINQNTYIDLGEALEVIEPSYGMIDNSGLFEEQGITALTHAYKVVDQKAPKMTKLTSRTERDAMAVDKEKYKWITMAGITVKETGGVHVEDLIGVSGFNGLSFESETFQEAMVKELTALANVGAANMEYLLLTTTQGKTLDPYDGSVAIDAFANTGTVRPTATIDARASNTNIRADLQSLANKVAALNGYNGNVGIIDLVVEDTDFNAIVAHPEFNSLYQLAFSGLGNAMLNNPMLNGQATAPRLTRYGYRKEFVIDNIRLITYPQKFHRWNGAEVAPTVKGKAWTIINGVSGLYQVKHTPAPYASRYATAGQKWLARSTGIVNDTHADITLESHLIPFMSRPEMSVDVTITTA